MSVILEALLSASFDMLFQKLAASTELLQFPQQKQIQEELKKWEMKLRTMEAVLEDAEERPEKDRAVKIWLGKLRNLAYDVEDILDEIATEALRRKLLHESHHQHQLSTWDLPILSRFNPRTVGFDSMIMSQVNEISTRLEDIASQKEQLGLKVFSGGRPNSVRERLPTTSLVTEAYVYGRKEDQEAMVELLLKNDSSAGNGTFSVIPIVGMGGIGKTTLAQLAYNDPKLEGHFDFKAWVCVSEKFNATEITKTILVCIGERIRDPNDLNNLQVMLKDKLSKKKFLFVLDDIWTGNPSDWSLLCRPFESGLPESKIIITTRNEVISTRLGTRPAYPLKGLSDEACLSIFIRCALGTTDFSL